MNQIPSLDSLFQYYLGTVYISEALKLKGTRSAIILQNNWEINSPVNISVATCLFPRNSKTKGKFIRPKLER